MESTVSKPGEVANNPRVRGTVKAVFPSRSYFWIAGEDGVDYYAHVSNLQDGVRLDELRIGDSCIFVPEVRKRGPAAFNIEMDDW